MTVFNLTTRAVAVIIAVGALNACAAQSERSNYVTAASYCQAQGSAMAVEQCEQYYARNHIEPPQPVVFQPEQPAMDSHDRAMLIAAFLSRPQPAPYNPWASALQPHPTINCSSNRVGDYVSTTCN
jgi:hypothetical protein